MNFQMFKLVFEKAEEPEIKLPTSTGSWKKQQSSRKTLIRDRAGEFACGAFDLVQHAVPRPGHPNRDGSPGGRECRLKGGVYANTVTCPVVRGEAGAHHGSPAPHHSAPQDRDHNRKVTESMHILLSVKAYDVLSSIVVSVHAVDMDADGDPLREPCVDTFTQVCSRGEETPRDWVEAALVAARSEERRVGKECRSRWSP